MGRALNGGLRRGLASITVAATLLGVATFAASGLADDGGRAADVPKAQDLLIGFADSSGVNPYPGSAAPERLAALMDNAGAEIARLSIRWDRVEPNPPGTYPYQDHFYDWSVYERQIEAYRRRGIGTVAVIVDAPRWANNPALRCQLPDSTCPPDREHIDDFALFAAALVQRFGGQGLAAVEVWNEPNLELLWQTRKGPNPEFYAAMFAKVRYAVRKVNPKLPVILGGVTVPPFNRATKFDMGLAPFLKRFYKAVPRNALDKPVGVAFHAYPGYKTGDNGEGNKLFDKALNQTVRITRRFDRGRALWATELGQSTTDPRGKEPPSERRQAQTIMRMIRKVDEQPRAVGLLIYTLVERAEGTKGQEGFGVVERGPTFKPKNAFCRIAEIQKVREPRGC